MPSPVIITPPSNHQISNPVFGHLAIYIILYSYNILTLQVSSPTLRYAHTDPSNASNPSYPISIQKCPSNIHSPQSLISHSLERTGTKIQVIRFTPSTSIDYCDIYRHIPLSFFSPSCADFTITEGIVVWICCFLGRIYCQFNPIQLQHKDGNNE